MSVTRIGKNNFTGGEFSPEVCQRTDLQKYRSGCKRMRNAIPLAQGGFTKRPGTVKTAAVHEDSRLIPFHYSATDSAVLVFSPKNGSTEMRVVNRDGMIIVSNTAYVKLLGIPFSYMKEANFTQSFDTLFLFHKNMVPKKLIRYDWASWTLLDMEITGSTVRPKAPSAVAKGFGTIPTDGTEREVKYRLSADINGVETYPSAEFASVKIGKWLEDAKIRISQNGLTGEPDSNGEPIEQPEDLNYDSVLGIEGYDGFIVFKIEGTTVHLDLTNHEGKLQNKRRTFTNADTAFKRVPSPPASSPLFFEGAGYNAAFYDRGGYGIAVQIGKFKAYIDPEIGGLVKNLSSLIKGKIVDFVGGIIISNEWAFGDTAWLNTNRIAAYKAGANDVWVGTPPPDFAKAGGANHLPVPVLTGGKAAYAYEKRWNVVSEPSSLRKFNPFVEQGKLLYENDSLIFGDKQFTNGYAYVTSSTSRVITEYSEWSTSIVGRLSGGWVALLFEGYDNLKIPAAAGEVANLRRLKILNLTTGASRNVTGNATSVSDVLHANGSRMLVRTASGLLEVTAAGNRVVSSAVPESAGISESGSILYAKGGRVYYVPNGTFKPAISPTVYNVYKNTRGYWTYIGSFKPEDGPFVDDNIESDSLRGPREKGETFDDKSYPSSGVIFQQRLVMANSATHPQTLWSTRSGTLDDLSVSSPLQDDDAITATIASTENNAVLNLIPLKSLLILTVGAEWVMGGGGSYSYEKYNRPITPGSLSITPQSYWGSSPLRPLVSGDSVLISSPSGEKVRDLFFSIQDDGYKGSELSILAPHLFEGNPIVSWAFQRSPWNLVWAVLADGKVASLTYMREQEVFAWALHDFGGKVLDVAVLSESGRDEVFFVIRRGEYVPEITLEKLDTPNRGNEVVYTDNGAPFAMLVETVDPEIAPNGESTVDWRKNIVSATVVVKETVSLRVGETVDDLVDFTFPMPSKYGEPPPKFSGTVTQNLKRITRNEASVVLFDNSPTPCTVLSVMTKVEAHCV